jgi:DNA ligase-associated metallophosphoesterase
MNREEELLIHAEKIVLLGSGGIFLPDTSSLLIADLHIGKAAHFRKAGVPIPASSSRADFQRLRDLIVSTKPKECIFLGDLGHSDYNKEWETFLVLRAEFPSLKFILIRGNHDSASDAFYQSQGIDEIHFQLRRSTFLLTHEPQEVEGYYNLAGHLHPAVSLKGAGRQKLVLPCFLFADKYGVLPAFTRFSGKYVIKPEEGQLVYAIVEGKIYPLNKKGDY